MVSTSAPETTELLEAYRSDCDLDARARLVANYLPLVRSICRRFRSSREPQEDLFQVGVIGLLHAIEKFDPDRGTSFSSLAIPEILGTILNFLRDHGSLLKIPRALRRNKLAVDRVSDSLASSLGRWPTVAEVAEACKLSDREVCRATEFSRVGDPRSLDENLESEDSEGRTTLSECVGLEDTGFDLTLVRLMLAAALATLPARERTILRLRFYNELSQRQTADLIDISQMHVSRLERGALYKLRLVLLRSSTA